MFTENDLRLIEAMCLSANPQYPDYPMYHAWESLYAKVLIRLAEYQKENA